MLPLSLLVITHNEAANIARCLDSVPFAAEKVVVDSGSSDDTVAIARAHGARVVHCNGAAKAPHATLTRSVTDSGHPVLWGWTKAGAGIKGLEH